MIELISSQEPFQHKPGRMLNSFPSISKSPLDQVDVFALHSWLTKHENRLAINPYSCDDSDDSDDCDGPNGNESDEDEEVEAIILDEDA